MTNREPDKPQFCTHGIKLGWPCAACANQSIGTTNRYKVEELRKGPITQERYDWLCRLCLSLLDMKDAANAVCDHVDYDLVDSGQWRSLGEAVTATERDFPE